MQTDSPTVMRLHVIHEIARILIGSTSALDGLSAVTIEKRIARAYAVAKVIVDGVDGSYPVIDLGRADNP